MARAGDTMENPITGEHITFLKTSGDTGGEFLRFEYLAPAHAAGPPLHVHPYQEERFVEILSGTLRARSGKDEQSFGKGESLTVSPGTPHTWRNDGEDEVRMLVEIRPALRMEEAFETTFDLARDGKTDRRGVPKNPLQAAATAREYSDELRLARPPFAVQKVLLGLLAPVSRLLRYDGRYPRNAPTPVPAELSGTRARVDGREARSVRRPDRRAKPTTEFERTRASLRHRSGPRRQGAIPSGGEPGSRHRLHPHQPHEATFPRPRRRSAMSSPLKRLTRKVFERHSNPWSAWTRLLSVPLVFVPLWTRSRKHAALVAAWMVLNPVVFPKPKDDSAWATKAMLGEEMWIARRPRDRAMAVNAVASAFGIGGVAASLKRRPVPTALCTVSEVALLLVYWRLMGEYYEEHRDDTG